MDMYNKRTAGRIAGIKIPKKVLTDFQPDCLTVEFPPRLEVADLDAACLDQFVGASESLEPDQSAAIEPSFEMLEDVSVDSQMRSAERSVVQEPREQSKSERAGDVNHVQGPQCRIGNTIRVVISKQQLGKLLAEGSIKKSAGCKELLPPCALQNDGPLVGDMAQLISNAMTMTRSPGSPWSPRLDTIAEAPGQLTRSPVIARDCKEVERLL